MSQGPPKPVVVVAAAQAVTREYLGGLLRGSGWAPTLAGSTEAAREAVTAQDADLVVLEAALSSGGTDTCEELRAGAAGYLPVLLVTEANAEERHAAFRGGADDVLTKPLDEAELLARAEKLRALRSVHRRVARAREALALAEVRDARSGLYNHRYAQQRMREELMRAERYREPLACVLVDLDQRESLRADGEARLDAAYRELAARVLRAVREIDVVARTPRDEVLLLLPSTPLTGALAVAERLWRSVGDRAFTVPGRSSEAAAPEELALTCTAGIGLFPSLGVTTPETLLEAAASALGEARRSGESRICVRQHQGYLFRPTS